LAYVYTNNNENYLARFSPDQTGAQKLMTLDSPVAISPDGQWIATFGYKSSLQADHLAYGKFGQPTTSLTPDKGFNVLGARFSHDSRYLFYTQASLESMQWLLGMLELDTGRRVEMIAPFGFDPASALPAVGFQGIADAVHYDRATSRLYLSAYIPYSDGNFVGLYVMDTTGIDKAATGRYPMPAARVLLKGGEQIISGLVLSPDATKMVYLSYDPANPPQNYEALGPGATFNVAGLVDLITEKTQVIARAGVGQGLGLITWGTDSQHVLLTGGNFGRSYFLAIPRLYTIDLAAGTVSEGPTLTEDTSTVISQIKVCGEQLYIVANKNKPDQGGFDTSLYTAPINKPTSRTVLWSESNVSLLQCSA
jgi:hypothetical protein